MLSINIERIEAISRLKFIEQKHYVEKITVEFWNTKKTVFSVNTWERERERERERAITGLRLWVWDWRETIR